MRRRWRELTTYDTWNVGVVTLPAPLRALDDLELRHVEWLPPRPALHYVADPFPFRQDDRDWLLVERYAHVKGVRGDICRIGPLDARGRPESASIDLVIRRERHISYPFTFEDGGETFCAPEMNEEEGCVLYRLERDGLWRPAHHILRGRQLVDPTLFRVGERWWLFATDPPPDDTSVLHAFYADTLAGPWTPHERNPLKRDKQSARPAGRPFTLGGRLFRPAQDCRVTYGGAVEIMEIVALTPSCFEERAARRLAPDPSWPYPHGLHHLVIDGSRIYFDAKKTTRDYLLALRQ